MRLKTRKYFFIFIIPLFFFLVFFLSFHLYFSFQNKKEVVLLDQKVIYGANDLENKIWIECTSLYDWYNLDKILGAEYDFFLYNRINKSIKNWTLKIKIPKDAFVDSFWNIKYEIHELDDENSFLVINPVNYNFYIKSNMRIPFGFILYVPGTDSNTKYFPKDYSLSYYNNFKLSDFVFYGVVLVLFCIYIVIIVSYLAFTVRYKVMRKKQRIYKKIIYQSISTFSKTIDAKDSYTKGHSKRVALYSAGIAKRLGFSKDEVERVYLIAILHDIGKIAVADHILRKPERLDPEELEIMKNHSVESGKILSNFTSIKDISLCVRHHHERYDGKGYPDGLKGEEIPLISRIIAVADSFDAMTSKRCYRDILPLSYVLNELELNKGSQFDPELTDIMIDMINDGYVEFVLTLPMN